MFPQLDSAAYQYQPRDLYTAVEIEETERQGSNECCCCWVTVRGYSAIQTDTQVSSMQRFQDALDECSGSLCAVLSFNRYRSYRSFFNQVWFWMCNRISRVSDAMPTFQSCVTPPRDPLLPLDTLWEQSAPTNRN